MAASHLRYTPILGALIAVGPLSAYLLGMAAGQLVYGPLSDRFGRKPPLYAGLALYVAASAGLALNLVGGLGVFAVALAGGGIVALMIPIFFCLASLGFIFPNSTALALAPFPERAGTASALQGTTRHLIGAVAGGLVGALHDASAVPMAAAFALRLGKREAPA